MKPKYTITIKDNYKGQDTLQLDVDNIHYNINNAESIRIVANLSTLENDDTQECHITEGDTCTTCNPSDISGVTYSQSLVNSGDIADSWCIDGQHSWITITNFTDTHTFCETCGMPGEDEM